MLKPEELYGAATANTMRIVQGVRGEQLGRPTPCAEWTVGDLIMHLIGGQQYAAGCLTGNPTGVEFGGIGTVEPVKADVAVMAAEYQRSISAVLAASRSAPRIRGWASWKLDQNSRSGFRCRL